MIRHRAYRALLRLLPRDFRDAHADEMQEIFAELRGTRQILAAFFDVIRRAPYEHWRRRGRPTIHSNRESSMSSLFSDVRFALRTFGRQPGATALIVATLSLAVAANTAVFALVDAVFVRQLPYANPTRLVDLNEKAPSWHLEFTGIDFVDFNAWRKGSRTFESMGLWNSANITVADDAGAERIEGQFVTWDLMKTLGVAPVLGRGFTAEEDVPNGPNVAMIGYNYWQTRYAGSPEVLGKTIRIATMPFTIIGVLPKNVTLEAPSNIWLPLRGDPNAPDQSFSYEGAGRLKPGVTVEQAQRDLEQAHEIIWRTRDKVRAVSPRVMPLRDRFVSEFRTTGGAMGGAVILVLLIACANVAGAMLARSVFRRREMGIRAALGASASRLTKQMMTESLVLAGIAGIIGTLFGRAGVGLVTSGFEATPPWMHLSMDVRATLFSFAIVVITAVIFGLVPTIQLRRQSASGALIVGSTRTAGSRSERRMLDVLVIVEVALAAVLLAAGGLLLRGYRNLRDVDPGFRPEGVASFRVSLPRSKYPDGAAQRRFYETLVERVGALPGVTRAGAVTCAPFHCHWGVHFKSETAAPKRVGEPDDISLARIATSGYFDAMGIKLVRGRFFDHREGAPRGMRPAVINEQLAKELWPDGIDPVGKRFGFRDDSPDRMMTVVGVVRDVRHYGLTEPMRAGMYLSMNALDSANYFERYTIVAHTDGDPNMLFAPMRAIVHELDPDIPLFGVQTMEAAVAQSMASRRAVAVWLVSLAAIALALAIGGIYAMLSYVVGRRRHELGIRMALGARNDQVMALVIRQGLRLVAIGVGIGIPVALFGTRKLESLLGGVRANDPSTYVSVAVLLTLTGVAAAWIPGRRAASVNPVAVMRAD